MLVRVGLPLLAVLLVVVAMTWRRERAERSTGGLAWTAAAVASGVFLHGILPWGRSCCLSPRWSCSPRARA